MNQPYTCGEFCPMRGCHECAFKGAISEQIDGQTDLLDTLEDNETEVT